MQGDRVSDQCARLEVPIGRHRCRRVAPLERCHRSVAGSGELGEKVSPAPCGVGEAVEAQRQRPIVAAGQVGDVESVGLDPALSHVVAPHARRRYRSVVGCEARHVVFTCWSPWFRIGVQSVSEWGSSRWTSPSTECGDRHPVRATPTVATGATRRAWCWSRPVRTRSCSTSGPVCGSSAWSTRVRRRCGPTPSSPTSTGTTCRDCRSANHSSAQAPSSPSTVPPTAAEPSGKPSTS